MYKIIKSTISRCYKSKSTLMGNLHYLVLVFASIILTSYQTMQNPKWVAPVEADSYKNPYLGNAKATEKGKKIYTKLCWTCHGKTGNGDGPAAAALTVTPADYSNELMQAQSDGAIFWKITNGRGEMVPYEKLLTDDQRWMLVNYIRDLGKSNNIP